MKKVLIIDSYDSFTYNLVHYVEGILDNDVTVYRNNEFNLEDVDFFTHIILSPGPGLPSEAGMIKELIDVYQDKKSILGVCLGMQAIAECYGASLKNLDEVKHGVASLAKITDPGEPLYRDVQEPMVVGRYHSWVVDPASLNENLEVTSVDEDGHIMSLRHRSLNIRGVQFHPESVLTPDGRVMLENYLKYC